MALILGSIIIIPKNILLILFNTTIIFGLICATLLGLSETGVNIKKFFKKTIWRNGNWLAFILATIIGTSIPMLIIILLFVFIKPFKADTIVVINKKHSSYYDQSKLLIRRSKSTSLNFANEIAYLKSGERKGIELVPRYFYNKSLNELQILKINYDFNGYFSIKKIPFKPNSVVETENPISYFFDYKTPLQDTLISFLDITRDIDSTRFFYWVTEKNKNININALQQKLVTDTTSISFP